MLIREMVVARVNAYSARECVCLHFLCACVRVRAHLGPLIVYGSGICWQWVAVQEREAESQYHGLKLCPSVAVWRGDEDD